MPVQYESVLRTVSYSNTSEVPDTRDRTITFSATDSATGTGNGFNAAKTGTATKTVKVAAVNDAPVASNGSFERDEDAAYSGTLVATDVDGPALTYSLDSTSNANGSVTITNASTGAFTYTPAPNFNGTAFFTFAASDGSLTSNTGRVNITVHAVNDAPVNTVPGTQTTREDVTLTFSAATNNAISVTDVDAGNASIEVTLTAVNGKIQKPGSFNSTASQVLSGSVASINSVLDGLRFVPDTDFNGTASLTIATNDKGNTGNGGAKTDSDTISITVTPVNDVPSFTKGTNVEVFDNAGVVVVANWAANLSAGPANESGQTLNFVVSNNNNAIFATQPSISPNGTLTFKPNTISTATGTATVTVSLMDSGTTDNGGQNLSAAQTFTITVKRSNTAPVAANDSYSVNEDGTLDVQAAQGVLANDTDAEGNVLTAKLINSVANGSLSLNANGSFTYTPKANYFGSDSFTYRVSDGSLDSGVATVTIDVKAVNDAPVLVQPADATIKEAEEHSSERPPRTLTPPPPAWCSH
jgi:VCBS repeat-containing protein